MHRPHFPDREQTSILSATLLLAFILAKSADLPARTLAVSLFGILIETTLDVHILAAILVAGLAATGTVWLIRGHPVAALQTLEAPHWILPALSAWVLAIVLFALPMGALWWIILLLGGGFLAVIWSAEYIVVDGHDPNFRLAVAGITTQSFVLFLVLAINLRAADTRLIFILPSLIVPVVLITLRFIHLKLKSQELVDSQNTAMAALAAGGSGVIAAQIITALHFLPLSPVAFGLAILAPVYALNIYLGNLADDRPPTRTIVEPAILLLAIWTLALLFN